MSGPFAGMRLVDPTTGSHIPKRLGCYEAELHALVESWAGYDRIIDIGCGEGWYVVGLARRMPDADIWGFDISADAQEACAAMARLNGVDVHVGGEVTAEQLNELITGATLVIVDIEGAEVDILDPTAVPRLRDADVLVELHDFLRPGATDVMLKRFPDHAHRFIEQVPRDPAHFPTLEGLSAEDRRRALSESRPDDQKWLWLSSSHRS